MKKAFSYAILLLATLLFAGCEEWLDVRLKSKVKSDDLLSSEQGFEDALVGVYSKLIGEELYGRQLTYGFFETLVGNYDLNTSNSTVYADVAKGSLSATNVRSVTDGFWNGLYNAIANLNNILDQIDGHRNLFSENRYALIKGEALGLRAFLHLELFKIFGDFSDLDAAAIPYVATLTKNPVPDSSGREVIARAIEDLEQAEALLRDADPVCEGTFSVEGDVFLGDRHLRMNYYAVRALQARALLWSGDKQTAYTAATQAAVERAEKDGAVVEMTLVCPVTVQLPYALYDRVTRLCSDAGGHVTDSLFTEDVQLTCVFHAGDEERFVAAVRELANGEELARAGEPRFSEF